jgi:hypothetical protein
MRTALRALADIGFSPLDRDSDPIVEVLSANGVAGPVYATSPLILGLDPAVWSQCKTKYGLVPSKQSMRLVIAEHLPDQP